MDEDDFLGGAFVSLETQAETTAQSLHTFTAEVARNGHESERATTKYRVSTAAISSQIGRSFDKLVSDGAKLSDVLTGLGRSISETTFKAAIRPVTDHLAGGITGAINGLLGFADGGAFSQGRVMPFARGGVVSSPVMFPMRGGMGLMGEAGPEAIMPLARGPDGSLGVRTMGGRSMMATPGSYGAGDGSAALRSGPSNTPQPLNVVMNIQTQDAESFRRSQSQIAAQMGRALQRGQRNR